MGALPQALEIIFEVQIKRINKKLARKKKKNFNSQNAFIFSSFWTPLNFIASNFLISYSF
jgi:hypothetical protein